jgi:exonuclease SbcD
MKILHTSDIHLKTAGDERWRAFQEIVRVARTEGAELLIISGDLFDKKIGADQLRTEMRGVFESLPARVLILPGNHDEGALREGQYFGDRVTVMNETASICDHETVRVIAMPFEQLGSAGVIEGLVSHAGRTRSDGTNILLFHGELMDMFYDPGRFGDEEAAGYMPVHLSDFNDLGFDYVLAGHFHAQFESRQYRGGYFVYPGSPVSVTRREQGRRRINLFQTGNPPNEYALDTFHYRTIVHTLDPFRSGDPLGEIGGAVAACHDQAEIELVVNGFIDLEALKMTEEMFKTELDSFRSGRVERVTHGWRNIGAVLQHELYRRFEERLRAGDRDRELVEKMRRMAIEAVMGVINAD